MHKVELSYEFGRNGSSHGGLRNGLMALLHAVQMQGSISGAADATGFSYRYVWGELKRWEEKLGRDLIVWSKGQRAQLTPFGEKLLWAERMAQARLAPQIASLHAELERALSLAFDDRTQVLTLFASHDEALVRLRGHAAASAQLHLDIHFCGSVDAIAALNEGRCGVAGFHTRTQAGEGSLAQRTYQPLLAPGRHKLIGFAERRQGLIVARGNPLRLVSLDDLVRHRARYVNRGLGTGTRLLLDELLEAAELPATELRGYANVETSHNAVAQAVASGAADAGLGIEAAARRLGLDFVPLAMEHYYLVCLKDLLDAPPTQALRAVLQGAEWQAMLRDIAGYEPWRSGEALGLRKHFPWWDLAPKRDAMYASS